MWKCTTPQQPTSEQQIERSLLQNNTLGPQTGGNMGDEYVHQHRFDPLAYGAMGRRHFPTTTGSFIDETYTYTIPEALNNVPIKIEDLEWWFHDRNQPGIDQW